MTRRNPTGPLLYDSDVEGTIRRNRREIRRSLNYINEEQEAEINTTKVMAENNPPPPEMAEHHAPRTMYDYAKPSLTGTESSIVRPTIAANNFELKPNTIQMIQQFVQFDGLQDEDPNTHLANFLEFYETFKINGVSDDAIHLRLFPFSLRNKAKQWLHSLPRGSITTWDQMAENFLLKYFPPARTAKFRDIIRRMGEIQRFVKKVPTPLTTIIAIGPNFLQRQLIDSAAGGTLNNKTPEAAYEFVEEMSLNNYQWQVTRTRPAKAARVYNINTVIALSNQVELLHKKFDSFYGSSQAHPVMQSDASEGVVNPKYPPYGQGMESEQMNYMAILIIQVGRTTPISHGADKEIKGNNHLKTSNNNPTHRKRSRTLKRIETKLEALSQELKDQIGQLTRLVSEIRFETLSRKKEQIQAVTLRSGKELIETNKDVSHDPDEAKITPTYEETKPTISYSAKLKKDRLDAQYGKFIELFKHLHINLPFVEAFSQMPTYAKFLKELLTNKRKFEEISTVELNEECSAIIRNKLPAKLKDPGSFTIPCLIGSLNIEKALADLGASINLMPYKMFKQLALGEPIPTRMADRSVKYPRGIIEDILVKVDKFIFPVDFAVLDMNEDVEVPLILRRPFLATAKAIINVGDGKLALRVGDEEIVFQIYDVLCYSREHDDSCYFVDATDHIFQESLQENMHRAKSSIVRPAIAVNIFELKPNTIQMIQQFVQFNGLQDEDPNTHIANFLELCDTFKINGVSDDAIRLRLFPFSLRNKAKQWLNSLPRWSITTWEQMTEKFLLKYFPPAKTAKLRNDISSFV
ncbi:retrotransposon gag protein [Gossypium australe]|uniref:Retrotransposon gag protein n=1 Tax=Gossypium australe TaxID=47621 RepID=A0A5B6USS6_9ROSI|nr:retrotransposon gag protein [Gossypium australe]